MPQSAPKIQTTSAPEAYRYRNSLATAAPPRSIAATDRLMWSCSSPCRRPSWCVHSGRGKKSRPSSCRRHTQYLIQFASDQNQMSGRHKHKNQRQKSKNRTAGSSDEPVIIEPEATNPEQRPQGEQNPVKVRRHISKPEPVVTVASVGLAAIVAVIYFFQWRAMVDTVDITRKASEREDRALVSIKATGDIQLVLNQPPSFK